MNWLRRLFGSSSSDVETAPHGSAPAKTTSSPKSATAGPPPSLEQQIAALAECGIRLRPGMKIEHLLESFSREDFEKKPFLRAVVALGGERERDNFDRFSDDIWHFDTECIEDNGDYIRIAERMRDLARGELPLANIADCVDVEKEQAWLEFDLDGRRIHWDLKFDNDSCDPKIFDQLAKLLAAPKAARKLTYLDLGGQDFMVGCATPQELAALKARTGLAWKWML